MGHGTGAGRSTVDATSAVGTGATGKSTVWKSKQACIGGAHQSFARKLTEVGESTPIVPQVTFVPRELR